MSFFISKLLLELGVGRGCWRPIAGFATALGKSTAGAHVDSATQSPKSYALFPALARVAAENLGERVSFAGDGVGFGENGWGPIRPTKAAVHGKIGVGLRFAS